MSNENKNNEVRLKELLGATERNTILFVSKYGSSKNGFLNDFINTYIADDTVVINFMYFSELHETKSVYDIDMHFKKQLELATVKSMISEEVKAPVEKESKPETKDVIVKVRFPIMSLFAIIFGLSLITLEVINYIENLQIIHYAYDIYIASLLYGLGAIFLLIGVFGFIKYAMRKKSKLPVKKSKVNKVKKTKIEKKDNEDKMIHTKYVTNKSVMLVNTQKYNTITSRPMCGESLRQTQRLDFTKVIMDDKLEVGYDLKDVGKKYFILYGLDEYVLYIEKNVSDSDEILKHVNDFMIKIHMTFKNFVDRKLIFVWKEKMFINPDLTILAFDDIFTLDGDFDENELRRYFDECVVKNGYVVDVKIYDNMLEKFNDFHEIDILFWEMKEFKSKNKLVIENDTKYLLLQFLKKYDQEKYSVLINYFNGDKLNVNLKYFMLSKSEFLMYTVDKVEVKLEFEVTGLDFMDYEVKENIYVVEQFLLSQNENDLYKYFNMEILRQLVEVNQVLTSKVMFSLLNSNVAYKEYFQKFINICVKDDKYYEVFHLYLKIILVVEKKLNTNYVYCLPTTYFENNQKVIVLALKHILQFENKYEMIAKNREEISQIIETFSKEVV